MKFEVDEKKIAKTRTPYQTEILHTQYEELIQQTLSTWKDKKTLQRFLTGDASVWTNQDENKWLGWVNIAEDLSDLAKIQVVADTLSKNQFSDVVVLGMGGSSLCPDMLSKIFKVRSHHPKLHVLDSTDPDQVLAIEDAIDLASTLFIVSSKSGTTLEPNIFKDYFYARLQAVLNNGEVGDRFIAITDPGTALEQLAIKEKFREIFHGVPSIGGRYSALSNFGMVPFGLMGGDVKSFLGAVKPMKTACEESNLAENPGVILGIHLGVCANHQKDKITFIISPAIQPLGAWLEQLIAESTGKDGKGLIPIDEEPLGPPTVYGKDRVFAYIRLTTNPDVTQDRHVKLLAEAGFEVVMMNVVDEMHLSAELFRWEVATAVVGSVIGINPFNQPDVEESKTLALKYTSQYEQSGQLKTVTPFYTEHGIALSSDERNVTLLKNNKSSEDLVGYLRAFLKEAKPGDYVDFAAFITMNEQHTAILTAMRKALRDATQLATCCGYGPRFLHSTGQAYKGGPNTGLFLQITGDPYTDLSVPTHAYTFGTVIAAQAQADFNVLAKRGRRVLRIHLADVTAGLKRLQDALLQALK